MKITMTCRLLLSSLYAFMTLLTLQSCLNHPDVVQPVRYRLKRTITTSAVRPNSKDTVIVTYGYNQQGDLGTEDYVHTNTYDPQLQRGNRSSFTYNARRQLLRIDTRLTNNKTYLLNTYATRLTYTYDSEGRIKTETKYRSTLTDPNAADAYQVDGVNTFTYSGSSFPSTVTNSDGTNRTFTFDNGNLILNGFTYDNKPNLYYGVIRGGGFDPRIMSANNAIRLYSADSNYKQEMTYNAAGLLTRQEIIHTNPNESVYNYSSQYAFEYEAY